ncbi:hypothetical protein ACIQTU_13600 [Brevundimonas sp. NPDC090276]|uniref:hypothetical protein n=1 Tax=Brevundimonas sp. NPDC090276 TaxID=3363956 RepID=UPI00383B7B5F
MLRYLTSVLFGAPVLLLASVVVAQTGPGVTTPDTAASAIVAAVPIPVPIPVPVPLPAAAPVPLSADELEGESGWQGVMVYAGSTQNLTATNSGNSIHAGTVGSGDINLAEGAFAGFSGIGNFVVNSGHNNNLQGSLSIIVVSP